MVSSGKTMCDGHHFRNNMMIQFKNTGFPIDYYGRSFNPFEKKEDVLRDYCFSITIENERYSNYYTEKLMDCFACGTIPIYYGTPEVMKMFNKVNAPFAGTIEEVLVVDDGAIIKKGQPLFKITPDEVLVEESAADARARLAQGTDAFLQTLKGVSP